MFATKVVNSAFISIAIPIFIYLLSFELTHALEDSMINQNGSMPRKLKRQADWVGAQEICKSDKDCHPNYKCDSGRCIDYCRPNPCGPNALHIIEDHDCICICPDGYEGDPFTGCSKQCRSNNDCDEFENCENNQCTDVCKAESCAKGFEKCIPRNHQAHCECADGFIRNTCSKCVANCTDDDDCHTHQKCENSECIARSTCADKPCGINTDCIINANHSQCVCKPGYTGDPSIECVKIECMTNYDCRIRQKCEANQCIDSCNAKSCGEFARCDVKKGHWDVCRCIPGYTGDARSGCIDRCDFDEDCPSFERCKNNVCVNECIETPPKLRHARCDVYQHTSRYYYCNRGYTNALKKRGIPDCHYPRTKLRMSMRDQYSCNPEIECLRTCSNDSNCYGYEKCIDEMCTSDVCKDFSCGENALCDSGIDGATCVCKRDFIGDPSVKCEKGCNHHTDCNHHEICKDNQCVSQRKNTQRKFFS